MSEQRPSDLAARQSAEELHKPIIRKFQRRKKLCFTDKIRGADLADMEPIRKFNKEIRFFLFVIDIADMYGSSFKR